jgi:hypothetical protein
MSGTAGFIDIPDSSLAAHEIVDDEILVKIAENANFGIVRCEVIFMGFYKNGDTIPVPISVVDGYQYSRDEIVYNWWLYTTRAPSERFVSGQAGAPGTGIEWFWGIEIGSELSQEQPGSLYNYVADIDDSTGIVSIMVSYFDQGSVAEQHRNDGVVKVFAICQRSSVNVPS